MTSSNSLLGSISPYVGHAPLAARIESMGLLSIQEKDALISDIAAILDGERRRAVFDIMKLNDLSQCFMPSPVDYEDNAGYQRACDSSRRLFQSFGLFQVLLDGSLIDHNMLHRPLLSDGSYYSKVESGPSVMEA